MFAHLLAYITIAVAGVSASATGHPQTVYLAGKPGVMRVVVVGLPNLPNHCTTFRCKHPFNPNR